MIGFFHLSFGFGFVTQLRSADKRICQYTESVHQKEQLATRINTIPSFFFIIHIYFCKVTD